MPRKASVKKREIEGDAVYGNRIVSKLINRAMRSGKKSSAAKEIYSALSIIGEKTNQDPMVVFALSLENVKPVMEVRPRRIGGAAYQVPAPVRGPRRESLAVRWLIQAANARENKEYHSFGEKLAAEIIDASQNQGGAVRKKDNVHKMAEANKAFAHFRW